MVIRVEEVIRSRKKPDDQTSYFEMYIYNIYPSYMTYHIKLYFEKLL